MQTELKLLQFGQMQSLHQVKDDIFIDFLYVIFYAYIFLKAGLHYILQWKMATVLA